MAKGTHYAFPAENDSEKQYNWINKGMTLRDYFAGQALVALIDSKNGATSDVIARAAYFLADAMLAVRAKESGQ